MEQGRLVIFGWADSAHVQRWARGLQERGWAVRVVSLGPEVIDGVDTVAIPRGGRLSYLTRSRAAARAALEFKPDIVHIHYAGGFGLWGIRAGFHPLVVSVWGADVIDLPDRFSYRTIIRETLRRADAVTATSEMLCRVTVERFPATADKVEVVPFGVRVPDELPPFPSGPLRLCYIKGHKRKYGPDLLLAALIDVREAIPDVRLTMAGEGEMTPHLKEMASALAVDDIVDFVGLIPNERIYSLVQEHHLMIMPSIMESESFGVAVLEASACGRPVIASRVGGVPEVLQDGVTGVLVPPIEIDELVRAIVELERNRERCAAMGKAGYEFVRERYTWERSLDMMIEIYARVRHG